MTSKGNWRCVCGLEGYGYCPRHKHSRCPNRYDRAVKLKDTMVVGAVGIDTLEWADKAEYCSYCEAQK